MFKLDYRIVHSEYDDFAGENGFFQIRCNDYTYGDIYPKEIETVIYKDSIYDWFERLARVVKHLMTEDYVALSDVESYNTWIVFQKENEKVIISIMKAGKENGCQDIAFNLKDPESGEWINQIVCFEQFRQEVIEKGREYVKTISLSNKKNVLIEEIKQKYDEIS